MFEICSRVKAQVRGLDRYFTGKPCKHGHVAERRTNRGTCLDCEKDSMKRWPRKPNPYKVRLSHLRRRYGLSEEDYVVLMELQKGSCACCGVKLCETRRPSVDHNHDTGKVRGIVCHGCNIHIRAFDSPLRKVYESYVDRGGVSV